MNLNLKMTVERSKRRSYFLSLVFITKRFTKKTLKTLNTNKTFVGIGLLSISHTWWPCLVSTKTLLVWLPFVLLFDFLVYEGKFSLDHFPGVVV